MVHSLFLLFTKILLFNKQGKLKRGKYNKNKKSQKKNKARKKEKHSCLAYLAPDDKGK